MKKIGIILLFLINAQAYGQVWDWAKAGTGPGVDVNSGIVADNGSYFVTGNFEDTLTLDTFNLYAVGSTESYIASYTTNGDVEWAIQTKSVNSFGQAYSSSICSDSYGNIFVLGYFTGQFSCGGITLTNTANYSMFLLKLDSTGTIVWARQAGNAFATGIDADNSGNVYTTGYYTQYAMFDADSLTNMGGRDIFIAKYDAQGNNLWVKQAGGSNSEKPNALCADSAGNIYITGTFSAMSPTGNTTFDNITIFTNGWEDIFIAKYDTNGNAIWAISKGSWGMDEMGQDIATDNQGNVYVTGRIGGTVTFGNDVISSYVGNQDMFIAKFDSSGTAIWGKNTGSIASPGYLCVDKYANSYVTGSFYDTAFYSTFPIYTSHSSESFIAKFDEQGILIWASEFGGKGAQGGVTDIDMDENNDLVFVGGYIDTASFGQNFIYPDDSWDSFVAKMSLPVPVGIEKHNYNDLSLYPNPTSTHFIIEGINKTYNLTIYNTLGQVIYKEKDLKESYKRVDVSKFNGGLFFIRIESEDEVFIKKIIKE